MAVLRTGEFIDYNDIGKRLIPLLRQALKHIRAMEYRYEVAGNEEAQADAGLTRRDLSKVLDEFMAVMTREDGWMDISLAPQDAEILIWVYAPPREGLDAIVCFCRWHPDAGHCVDEIRSPTLWRLAEKINVDTGCAIDGERYVVPEWPRGEPRFSPT